MKSKLAGIKKINILRGVVILNCLIFLATIFLSIFVFKANYLWFFFFCICAGNYLLVKSHLYNTDSNFYLGNVLLFLGLFFVLNHFYPFSSTFYLIVSAFVIGGVFTYIVYRQLFHLFVSEVLLLIMASYFAYRQNIINIYIFFGLIALFIFIFSFIYVKIKMHKKN